MEGLIREVELLGALPSLRLQAFLADEAHLSPLPNEPFNAAITPTAGGQPGPGQRPRELLLGSSQVRRTAAAAPNRRRDRDRP